MANAQANASAGGSPAKYEVIMPKDIHGQKMGNYGENWVKDAPGNTIRSKNMKRMMKAKPSQRKKPRSHNPY